MQRIADRFVFRVITANLDVEVVAGLDPQVGAYPDRVGRAIGILVLAEYGIHFLEVAVTLQIVECDAQTHGLGNQCRFGRALQLPPIVIAVAAGQIAVRLGQLGLASVHVDRAAGGVATEQRALRPAQHFNTLQIVELEAVRITECLADFVDIDADRGGSV